ncbi:MarR family winged helix-turn-helix transcriptional regulator [Serinicoccus marinus]|uniref:MarR family winged helix-turn-helix transcriptional regulator n=1 Tax=Serinicoccus marinus TaxID=247333 RepID=UPI0024932A1D|nr:MarR family transcriptional regulator [Serinicoccus marinus]
MQLSEELARTFTAMGRLLREREGELSRSDVGVLVRLAGQECTRSRDLARAEGLDPSTMSRRLASLAERGLVQRHPDPEDRRAQVLGLTAAGRAALAAERSRRVELVTATLADWPAHDQQRLADMLARLADSIEQAQEHATPPRTTP